jgi:erythromycin esterase-like protein
MVRADASSWNVRDTHMADTLDRLLERHGPGAMGVVWEHNTHVGDARGTDMAAAGLVNVGQLVRERHGTDDVAIVGFGGHRGHVIAADAWGSAPQRLPVPPAPVDTHEALLHDALGTRSLLLFDDRRDGPWTGARHGHRAIGVVYHPHAERRGNWVPTVMGRRYDAFVYFETTEALEPLPAEAATDEFETWPFGR